MPSAYKLASQALASLPRPVQQNAWLLAPITILVLARLVYLVLPVYASVPVFLVGAHWAHGKIKGELIAGAEEDSNAKEPAKRSSTEDELLAELAAEEAKEEAKKQRRKSRQDSKRKAKAAKRASTANDEDASDDDDAHLANIVQTGKKSK
eukprot:CAMPEP_0118850508 /NCGR_PEP_ID=MMETSP1163-20130328/333_1 /TAXON_ID=124430 /ORGANISM="Phaeomonas parva, Strain CCMP2877" /LENGTH=150 /DNA_ID=CAMNT_0006782723 /DNA_START=211 /DNA_END=663 /DNA_ORIENTATION=+